MEKAEAKGVKLLLPEDVVIADKARQQRSFDRQREHENRREGSTRGGLGGPRVAEAVVLPLATEKRGYRNALGTHACVLRVFLSRYFTPHGLIPAHTRLRSSYATPALAFFLHEYQKKKKASRNRYNRIDTPLPLQFQ